MQCTKHLLSSPLIFIIVIHHLFIQYSSIINPDTSLKKFPKRHVKSKPFRCRTFSCRTHRHKSLRHAIRQSRTAFQYFVRLVYQTIKHAMAARARTSCFPDGSQKISHVNILDFTLASNYLALASKELMLTKDLLFAKISNNCLSTGLKRRSTHETLSPVLSAISSASVLGRLRARLRNTKTALSGIPAASPRSSVAVFV